MTIKVTFTDGTTAEYSSSPRADIDNLIAEIEDMAGQKVESWEILK